MAEEALKKLEEQLNCSICLDIYTDPKQLQCHHVFCQQCLVPLVVRDQQGQLGLTCPTCRQVTPIPDRGVAGLQSAFLVSHLLEIQDSVKKLEHPLASTTPERAVGGTTVNRSSSDMLRYCFEHVEEELKLYCETCGELVCYQCVIKGGKHHDHEYALMKKAFEKHKEEIASSLEPMEKQVIAIKRALVQLDKYCEEISKRQLATEGKIHITFRCIQEILSARKIKLIDQLNRKTEVKLKVLAAQRDQIETTLAQLNSCLHFMRESLGTANKRYLLRMKTNTVEQIKELTTLFQHDIGKPKTEMDIAFSAPEDMTTLCETYGHVFIPHLPDPSKCHILSGSGVAAVVGVKSTAVLQVINFVGKPCEEPIESFECELVSELTGTRAICRVERRGQDQYEISYQPTIKGRHRLHIKVEEEHIRGSPVSVIVTLPLEKLGTSIRIINKVDTPQGVAINLRGDVVVTERCGHCVSIFSPSGEKLQSFGAHISDWGQFLDPCGVTVDGEGNILVADIGNHCIQKFNDGQFLAAVGTKGRGPLQFLEPIDIAFNSSSNKLYVLDKGNYRVQVLNSDLTFSHTFGKAGVGSKGKFGYVVGIACDNIGKVYIADNGNHCIQVFTAEGKYLNTFGQGTGLYCPNSIAIDAGGVVYVSEGYNNRVSVFTSEGQFVTSFGRKGERPGEFEWPSGVAVDGNGVLYVCGINNNRIQLF